MVVGMQSGHKITVGPYNLPRATLAPKLKGFNKGSEIILKGFSKHGTEIYSQQDS